MNTQQYEHMVKTGEAPCGCHVEISGSTTTVLHVCEEYGQERRSRESEAANEKSIREHMERNERNLLFHTIPLAALRKLLADSGEELQERKAVRRA